MGAKVGILLQQKKTVMHNVWQQYTIWPFYNQNIQNPQNFTLSASESHNRSIRTRQSIGDAEPDDPRLGGIGEEERKKICYRFVSDLFPKKQLGVWKHTIA